MVLTDLELEKREKEYFEQIFYRITNNKAKLLNLLNSANTIKKDWLNKFRYIEKKKQTSELARGAERVFYYLLNQYIPNSAPIGADLFFENHNAFIHIDINTAKEKYCRIKEIYPLIPEGCKRYLCKRIKKIRIAIDKKDIFNLVNEYEEAKKQGRKEDALRIYTSIKVVYKRLPQKYKEIIYNKLFKSQEI